MGPFSWTIGEKNALPSYMELAPGQTKVITMTFTLPDGEYDFLCGYGGGVHESACLASNLSAFNVTKGKAIMVQ